MIHPADLDGRSPAPTRAVDGYRATAAASMPTGPNPRLDTNVNECQSDWPPVKPIVRNAMYVHAAIAQALHDNGVDAVFGLMGDGNLFVVDSFVRNTGGRFISVTHEAAGVLAANG